MSDEKLERGKEVDFSCPVNWLKFIRNNEPYFKFRCFQKWSWLGIIRIILNIKSDLVSISRFMNFGQLT